MRALRTYLEKGGRLLNPAGPIFPEMANVPIEHVGDFMDEVADALSPPVPVVDDVTVEDPPPAAEDTDEKAKAPGVIPVDVKPPKQQPAGK